MAEKKGVTSSACMVVLVMMTLLVGENSAAIENPECYAGCLLCAGGGFWISVAWCSLCVASCYADSPSLVSVPKDNYYFCRLGCASSLCASFINEQDPTSAIEKVGGCVDSCSEKCSTARSLPHD